MDVSLEIELLVTMQTKHDMNLETYIYFYFLDSPAKSPIQDTTLGVGIHEQHTIVVSTGYNIE